MTSMLLPCEWCAISINVCVGEFVMVLGMMTQAIVTCWHVLHVLQGAWDRTKTIAPCCVILLRVRRRTKA